MQPHTKGFSQNAWEISYAKKDKIVEKEEEGIKKLLKPLDLLMLRKEEFLSKKAKQTLRSYDKSE